MISYAALDAALLSGGSDVVAVQKLHHAPHAHTHTHTHHMHKHHHRHAMDGRSFDSYS